MHIEKGEVVVALWQLSFPEQFDFIHFCDGFESCFYELAGFFYCSGETD